MRSTLAYCWAPRVSNSGVGCYVVVSRLHVLLRCPCSLASARGAPITITTGFRAVTTSNNNNDTNNPPSLSSSLSFVNAPFNLNKYEPDEIRRLLAEVDELLAEPDKEPYGHKNRGRETFRLRMKEEAPVSIRGKKHKINLNVANAKLKTLIYQRHALQHGAKALTEFNRQTLTKSFLGEGYGRRIPIKEARYILTELWRYGKSSRLEFYQKETDEYKERQRQIEERKVERQKKKDLELQKLREAIQKSGPSAKLV